MSKLAVTHAGVGAIRLLVIALVASTVGDAHGGEPERPGPLNFISRAVFAAGRLWLLTDSGALSTITPGDKVRVPAALPEPALDLCVADGRPAVLTCPRGACKSVTLRRWAADKWTPDAPIALEDDRVVALACSPENQTILTDKRLIENVRGRVSVRQLSYSGQAPKWVSTTLHVTAEHVFAGINAGEWGGGLVRIDRKTGVVTRIEKNAAGTLCGGPLNTNCDPVNGIAAEPWKPGCVAAAIGLVHDGLRGRIVEICNDDVRASYDKVSGNAPKRYPGRDFPAAFFGLTRVGMTLLASGTDGVYRFDGSAEARYAPLPAFDVIGGVGVSFAVPNVVLVLTAINRRYSMSGEVPLLVSRLSESKPYEWFDATFPKLPKLARAATAPARWQTVRTKDGLSMRVGGDFGPRGNDYCWVAHTEKWPGPGWKDVCLFREDRELFLDDFRLRPAAQGDGAPSSVSPDVVDLVGYDSWSAGAIMLQGRRAIVERGRASGGMAGHKRERTLRVLLELSPGEWVSFSGRTGDDAGYNELLSIASTIEAAWP